MTDAVTNKDLFEKLEQLENKLTNLFVSKDAFAPVKAIAYGLAGLVMMAVGTAIVASVLTAGAWVGII